MATTATFTRPRRKALFRAQDATTESWAVRGLLIGTAVLFLGIFLFLPLAVVFTAAFAKGVSLYLASLREPDALAAIRLTLLTAAIAVPVSYTHLDVYKRQPTVAETTKMLTASRQCFRWPRNTLG